MNYTKEQLKKYNNQISCKFEVTYSLPHFGQLVEKCIIVEDYDYQVYDRLHIKYEYIKIYDIDFIEFTLIH